MHVRAQDCQAASRVPVISAIIENMAEFRPGLCTEAAQQGLMQWLLKRIKVSGGALEVWGEWQKGWSTARNVFACCCRVWNRRVLDSYARIPKCGSQEIGDGGGVRWLIYLYEILIKKNLISFIVTVTATATRWEAINLVRRTTPHDPPNQSVKSTEGEPPGKKRLQVSGTYFGDCIILGKLHILWKPTILVIRLNI